MNFCGALVAIILLLGSTVAHARDWSQATTDRWGNVYPEWCRRDLSDLNIPKMRVPLKVINQNNPRINTTIYGLWVLPKNANTASGKPISLGVILLSEQEGGWAAEEDEHHEECHGATYKRCLEAGGKGCDGAWHP